MTSTPEPTYRLPIVWQSESCLVVQKPAGLATTSPPGTESLESRLRTQLGDSVDYLTAVHRLDRPVAGLVLIALRKKAARLLSEQFRSRLVQKKYLATVVGDATIACSNDVWRDHIAKLLDQPRVQITQPDDATGRAAETHVRLLRYDAATDRSHLELNPVTGRMHQLRIQCAARGHAICGDPIYGTATDESNLQLIACELTFRDPKTGKQVTAKVLPSSQYFSAHDTVSDQDLPPNAS